MAVPLKVLNLSGALMRVPDIEPIMIALMSSNFQANSLRELRIPGIKMGN
jgi:hypothetical protein